MRRLAILGLMLMSMMNPAVSAADSEVLRQLVPTGKLRVGIAYAPNPTPLFAAKSADGDYRGVPRAIGEALAKSLGVPVEFTVTATTGELTEACVSGAIDVGFMPEDAERRKRLDFSPPYFVIESTYLASEASGIRSMAEVDREGVTVVGIEGSTTMRASQRSLTAAKVITAKSIDEAMEVLQSGGAQAFALTHDSLPALQARLPGSLILEGAFQRTGVAIALRKDHPAALGYLKTFIESAKADGRIRRAFDDAGLKQLPIAP
jgi:polar amino acid transport system substrate-binding protein